jgi:hypothetical protein
MPSFSRIIYRAKPGEKLAIRRPDRDDFRQAHLHEADIRDRISGVSRVFWD